MATVWSLTRTPYATTETRNLIGGTGPANTHEVEVRGVMVGIESVSILESFGEGETEVGVMDMMTMRTVARGGSSNE